MPERSAVVQLNFDTPDFDVSAWSGTLQEVVCKVINHSYFIYFQLIPV